jgi:hypothetical protein
VGRELGERFFFVSCDGYTGATLPLGICTWMPTFLSEIPYTNTFSANLATVPGVKYTS